MRIKAVSRVAPNVPGQSDAPTVTIGKLARAAEVGVETIRYYQRRRLLAVPQSAAVFGVTQSLRSTGFVSSSVRKILASASRKSANFCVSNEGEVAVRSEK